MKQYTEFVYMQFWLICDMMFHIKYLYQFALAYPRADEHPYTQILFSYICMFANGKVYWDREGYSVFNNDRSAPFHLCQYLVSGISRS